MKELDKAHKIELTGPAREDALKRFHEKIKQWGVALPPAEVLVLDFGLNDFNRVGLIECWIANEIDAGYCGKYLFLFDGQRCPEHHHRDKHETFHVVKGSVIMTIDGQDKTMNPGDVEIMPTHLKHTFIAQGSDALLLEISKPCIISDNYFEDPHIPLGGNFLRQE